MITRPSLQSSERGALHIFAIIVLLVSIAQVVYLRHLLDELDKSRAELAKAHVRIEELESRLGKVENTSLRDRVHSLSE